jgi:hypothetical protein
MKEMTGAPVPNTKKSKQAARRERVAALRAQQKRAERRRNLITIGAIAAVIAVIIGGVAWYAASRSSGASGSSGASAEVIPPGVTGQTTVQAAAHQVPDTSGIPGVTGYVTTGWPTASHNGPAAEALAHDHVTGPVVYSVTPPAGGPHNATWMNCGIYDQPVPSELGVLLSDPEEITAWYAASIEEYRLSGAIAE